MKDHFRVSRRAFLGSLGAATACADLARPPAASGTVIDAHAHLYHRGRPAWSENDRKLIDAADKLGIDQLCCSILAPETPSVPESFRARAIGSQ